MLGIGGGEAKGSYVRLFIVVVSGKSAKAWCRQGLRERGVKVSARSSGLRHVLGWRFSGARMICDTLNFVRCCQGFAARGSICLACSSLVFGFGYAELSCVCMSSVCAIAGTLAGLANRVSCDLALL